ncbi:MAG: sigma-70 family RNA polymerase sigma factor [Lachnospiraceae bacterium]|nr:sigma-70 family RNA polymerase sigma factor [Lachnospiraceae bacterium]
MTDKDFKQNIELIKNKDKAGLKTIYVEYVSLIYHTVLNIVKQKEDAEDITSDFFIKLATIAEKYKSGNGHRTWLITIARNMAIDYIRSHNKEVPAEDTLMEQQPSNDTPEEQYISATSFKELIYLLNQKEQEVLTYKIMGELTFKEIAAITEEPMGTITWRYNEAIKKLRRNYHE